MNLPKREERKKTEEIHETMIENFCKLVSETKSQNQKILRHQAGKCQKNTKTWYIILKL